MAQKILIVEDEAPIRHALSTKFINSGFEVVEAEDGQEGLEMAQTHLPDLILLDFMMPRMNGMAMLKTLRESEWGKDLKVIVLTNVTDTDAVAASLSQDAYDYLVKSDWKIEDILQKAKEVLAA